jgi:hypothetical protein
MIREYGYWHDTGPVSELLRCVKTDNLDEEYKYNTYLILSTGSDDRRVVAIDGRRMVIIKLKKGIAKGHYVLTDDGYYLPVKDARFPDWEGILKKTMEYPSIYKVDIMNGPSNFMQAAGIILGELVGHRSNAAMDLYIPVVRALDKFSIGTVELFVSDKEPEDKPFRIEITAEESITYLQMPVEVK